MAWAKLSARQVAATKKAGWYGDGGGLWLQVGPGGGKSWLLRFMLRGRARAMGLGSVELVSLAAARDRAAELRKLLAAGIDPLEQKREAAEATKSAAALCITFRDAAEKYIASHAAGWRDPKHGPQWTSTLSNYVHPTIGGLGVDAIEVGHVLKILEPIWSTKTETASRVRGRIEAVLDWATARGYRAGDNPARWRGHLDKLLPAKSKVAAIRHQPAMPFPEVPAFVAELRAATSISARALEFTILCATRTGETLGATWSEIDLAAKLWVIPAARTKADREHRIPLSGRAVEILAELPREGGGREYIWPGARANCPLSNMAMLELLRGMRPGLTVHGFRSSFRDWAGEATNFPRELAEAALAHVLKDRTEAAYRRGDALQKRRLLMDAWSRFLASPARAPSATVVAIRAAGE